MFRVGMKVVCVDDAPKPGTYWMAGEEVVRGQVYTVTSIHSNDYAEPALWLAEVSRSDGSRKFHGRSVGYGPSRFRPVQTKSTDTGVSILKSLLQPSDRPNEYEEYERFYRTRRKRNEPA